MGFISGRQVIEQVAFLCPTVRKITENVMNNEVNYSRSYKIVMKNVMKCLKTAKKISVKSDNAPECEGTLTFDLSKIMLCNFASLPPIYYSVIQNML